MVKRKLQVFISSTYEDLKEERQAALEAVLKSGNIPSGMEYFNGPNSSTLEMIYKWIDDSDIFILIIGGKYGSLDENHHESYTQLEYEYARKQGKQVIAFVLTDSFLKDKVIKSSLEKVTEQVYPQLHKDFINLVKNSGNWCHLPNNLADIREAIAHSIPNIKSQISLAGWVSGREYDLLQTKLDDLRKEYDDCLSKTLTLKESVDVTVSRDVKITEQKHNSINPEDIKVTLNHINYTVDTIELNFDVLNHSTQYLSTPGRFSFKTDPEMYQDELNNIGFSIQPLCSSSSLFVYPKDSYRGKYTYNFTRHITLSEITYYVQLYDGIDVPIRKWGRAEIKQLESNGPWWKQGDVTISITEG